jgi:hypothetical protein
MKDDVEGAACVATAAVIAPGRLAYFARPRLTLDAAGADGITWTSAVHSGCKAMSYVRSVLQHGEMLQYETTVHWFIYFEKSYRKWIGPFIITLGLIAAAVYANAVPLNSLDITSRMLLVYGAALFAVITLILLRRPFIARLTTELAITNRRLIYKTGFFKRDSIETNLSKVETVLVHQSIIGRLLKFGEIEVQGGAPGWKPIPTISNPLTFRGYITGFDH